MGGFFLSEDCAAEWARLGALRAAGRCDGVGMTVALLPWLPLDWKAKVGENAMHYACP